MNINIDNQLDLLKQIKEVDAPPFLLTRIRQQIQNLDDVEAPVQWKWAFALTSIAILALNISIFFTSANTEIKNTTGIETVISSMHLATTNSIYNE
ncbi:MAG: hypothetical protein WBP08_02795 [Saprospiraceae bacterium]|jgi:hypothetical protein|nr:hypothetical protein [Saprospiraceae bacterium]